MPSAKIDRSKITTGIKDTQTAAGRLNAQIQIAPPTEWIVNVVPRLLATKDRLQKGQTRKGINQKRE